MKIRKPLSEKELHKFEETRDPRAEAIAGLQDYKRGVARRITGLPFNSTPEAISRRKMKKGQS